MKKKRWYLFWIALALLIWYLYSQERETNDKKEALNFQQSSSKSSLSSDEESKKQKFDFLPVSNHNRKTQVLSYKCFTLSFVHQFRMAEWVAYSLTKQQVLAQDMERSNDFRPDSRVNSALPTDYLHSGYDRGHLCPSEDMNYDPVCMSESFLMTNIAPQIPDFNRGIWKSLENHVRIWAKENEVLYVVTGPVFTQNMEKIGKNQIPVPKYFYKIILDYHQPEYKMIGFLIPNEKSERSLLEFRVSVDSIEALTGIDFFPALPDHIEDKFEDSNFNEPLFSGLSDRPKKKRKK
ncbi:MAG: DNA/RNA non-specific endonuclease [Cytophagales bacterium]|nr:DNA/RNA non-specific endonuclease [Cytophagales bacterium]MDW8384923.1 DNA/RNA non-specific endonuclease [Flammeovirgaceae bacterium]